MDKREKILNLLEDMTFLDLPISVYITTLEGEFIECNRSAREMLGLNVSGPITQTILALYENIEQREQLIKKTIDQEKQGDFLEGEIITFRRNGEEKLVCDYCRTIRDPDTDEVLGFIGCLVDVTMEQRYHQLFERLPAGVYRVDKNNTLKHVNEAFIKMFGYDSKTEIEGRQVEDLYVNHGNAADIRNIVAQAGFVEKQIVELIKKSGETFYASVNAFKLIDAYGNYCGREGTIVDVTQEELYRRNLNLAPVGFYQVKTTKGKDIITYVNDQFVRLFGNDSPDELVGKDIITLYANPQDHPVFRKKLIEEADFGHDLLGEELQVKRKDESNFTIRVYSRALQDHKGRVIGRTGVVIDISEEVMLREKEERARKNMQGLMSDLGRALHPFSTTFLMLRQTIDSVIQNLEYVTFEIDRAPTVLEADDALKEPADKLAESMDALLTYRSDERGAKALSDQNWQILAEHRVFLENFQSKIAEIEHRPYALYFAALEIIDICSSIRKGIIAREPVRTVCDNAKTLSEIILYIQLRRSRSSLLQMDHQVRALRDFLTRDFRPEEIQTVQWVRELLADAIQPLTGYARDQNIEIRISDELPGARVSVARREVVRALQNLLHNAIKYSWDPSPSRVRFVSIHVSRKQDYVYISFQNYGVPITQEEINKELIFQVGYRGIVSGDRSRMGTGIGLPDALNVAKDHGGDILITSRPASSSFGPEDYTKPFLTRVRFILPLQDIRG